MLLHGLGGGAAILGQKRVGDAVGEMAIGFVVHAGDAKRQMLGEGVKYRPGSAITGVDHQMQRL